MLRFCAALTGCLAVMSSTVLADSTFTVPRGTTIPVQTTTEMRIGGMGASDQKTMKFEVSQDVIVNGHYVAKKGDLAEGHYASMHNASGGMFSVRVSNEVEFDVDDIVNYCGDTLKTAFAHTVRGGMKMGAFTFGPKTQDVVVPKGTVFLSQTDRIQRNICSDKTTAQPQPLPSGDNVFADDAHASPSPSPSGR